MLRQSASVGVAVTLACELVVHGCRVISSPGASEVGMEIVVEHDGLLTNIEVLDHLRKRQQHRQVHQPMNQRVE